MGFTEQLDCGRIRRTEKVRLPGTTAGRKAASDERRVLVGGSGREGESFRLTLVAHEHRVLHWKAPRIPRRRLAAAVFLTQGSIPQPIIAIFDDI
jgi:hypothetical protein